MKYEITKNPKLLKVFVSIKKRNWSREPVETVDTEKVLDILKKEGYNIEKYTLEKESQCTNYKRESCTEGEWVFKLKEVETNAKPNNNRRPAKKQQPQRRHAKPKATESTPTQKD